MWHSLRNLWRSASAKTRLHAMPPRSRRLTLEQLEDRLTPSNYTAANVSQLIADINAANKAGGANTITLTAPTNSPYTLAAVDNTTDGATGLPVIAAKDNLTILGNGDTIERSSASGTPAFRLFDVTSGASLTLQNMTLQGGLANGAGVLADGGAIYNQGTLDLSGVTVQNNSAIGANGQGNGSVPSAAFGGGIYSNGSLTLEGGTILQSNLVCGGVGSYSSGANGFGGGLYVGGGTATLTDVTLSANAASGGVGGITYIPPGTTALGTLLPGGNGYGGGLAISGGTVILNNDTLINNTAQGGRGGWGKFGGLGLGGNGFGGGLYAAGGTITLLDDTVSGNTAKGGAGGGGFFERHGPNGFGGALYVAGGTVALTSDTLSNNVAEGLYSFYGGAGEGGALYAAGGTITLRNDTVTGNAALGGSGARVPGAGTGGGLYIASAATVYLDAFTLAHTINNTASTSNNDIFGSYILIP
jgi:hypothetical protein